MEAKDGRPILTSKFESGCLECGKRTVYRFKILDELNRPREVCTECLAKKITLLQGTPAIPAPQMPTATPLTTQTAPAPATKAAGT